MEDILWVFALVGGPILLGAVIAVAMQLRSERPPGWQMRNRVSSDRYPNSDDSMR
ncbi:hypothetical protein FHW16_002015 [Phyllobacterium myrsinacearum]|uniref:Uncharacterized protein n=1 Tax=Phyllobacterium myrsinacearum TaxID=28101 RepID=A0A839EE08_9HYPH|nr:hypothetical protein [Phyllobacterium myrsinacearum]